MDRCTGEASDYLIAQNTEAHPPPDAVSSSAAVTMFAMHIALGVRALADPGARGLFYSICPDETTRSGQYFQIPPFVRFGRTTYFHGRGNAPEETRLALLVCLFAAAFGG